MFGFQHSLNAQTTINTFNAGKILLSGERIAGNFGELRGNHFHSGIDYKTNETEGWPVLAADNGYISRVKVSASGYGKVIYITHSSGVVTVYGHLRAFYPAITDSVESIQLATKQFELEFFPDSSRFKVNAGQLIGFSGSSGSAEGPHVHFETRNRDSEKPINPEIMGYPIDDTIPPVLKALVIYHPGLLMEYLDLNDNSLK
ncbi:MAG: M23 family metallopeptidase [Bacteroidetes bacterium]|nr:M23 family metallopeptidase [Bacteroidota bacterium]